MTAIILYDCADKETTLKKVLLTVFEESESDVSCTSHFTLTRNWRSTLAQTRWITGCPNAEENKSELLIKMA